MDIIPIEYFLIFRRRELSYTHVVSSVFGQGAGRRRRRSWLQSTWKWICKLEQWIIAFSINISFFYLVYSFPLSVHATMLVSSGATDFPSFWLTIALWSAWTGCSDSAVSFSSYWIWYSNGMFWLGFYRASWWTINLVWLCKFEIYDDSFFFFLNQRKDGAEAVTPIQ